MRRKTTTRTTQAEQIGLDQLAVYAISTTKASKVRSVREYVDLATGEIIPADQLSLAILDLREKYPARRAALASLRPEVRAFASFVLRFANKRRGITPGIEDLCQWYAQLNNKLARNVRRYVPALLKAGILAGDTLLGRLFQRTGRTASNHLGEDFRAWCIFQKLAREPFDPATLRGTACADASLVAAEVTQLDAELKADVESWAVIMRASRSSGTAAAVGAGQCLVTGA